MGFLSSLFKKKSVESQIVDNVERGHKGMANEQLESPRGFQSLSGLYPNEVALLFYAPKYITTQKEFPDYLRTTYHIGFPNEVLHKLQSDGYIRESFPSETLNNLKMPELKKIATDYNLKVSGKKAELIERLVSNISDNDLAKYVLDRYWILTDKGEKEIRDNDYLTFLIENHPYSYMLNECGITLYKLNQLHYKNPKTNIRDLIWGELNNSSMNAFRGAIENGDFHLYCTLLHVMSQFLEEEKRYYDSLSMYARYFFYQINFEAGMKCASFVSYCSDGENASNIFYTSANIAPCDVSAIMRLSAECSLTSSDLKNFFMDAFSAQNDTGIFSNQELADYIMYELSGDEIEAKALCDKATKSAAIKMKKYCR